MARSSSLPSSTMTGHLPHSGSTEGSAPHACRALALFLWLDAAPCPKQEVADRGMHEGVLPLASNDAAGGCLSPGRPVPPSFLVPSYSPPPPHSPWPSRLGFPNRAAKSRELQERVALLQQQVHARVRARSCAKCAVIRSTLRYPMPQITIRFPILRPWPCTRAKAGTPDSKPCFLSNPYPLYPTPRTPTLTHQASVSGLVCEGWSSWCRVY